MKKAFSILAAAGILSLSSVAAHASSGGTTSFTTTAGTGLSITGAAPGSLSAVTIDGSTQTQYATLGSYTAVDSTGTGSGWKIQFSASPFTCAPNVNDAANKCPSGGNSLPAGSLTMAPPTVACDAVMAGTACSGQGAVPSIPFNAAGAIDNGTVTVASAAVNTGMGTYDFTPGNLGGVSGHNLQLVIPSTVYAGATYSSTLTVSVGSGPN